MENKKGLGFSFGWLFALVVGAMILFLAIYAAVKFIGGEQMAQETEAAKQLEIILTPIETSYEEAKAPSPIGFPDITRVYNNCSTEGNFGKQSIRVSTMFGKKWQEQGLPIISYNKYIFSPSVMQTKEMYVLSKPFEMPFKVANLLFIWSDKYCFVNPIIEIKKEITDLNLKNINTTDSITKCEKGSRKVCFVSFVSSVSYVDECDVFVDTITNSVTKKGRQPVYYGGKASLLYGAIFSEPRVYECQTKRLMKRTSELALIYNAKSMNIAAKADGCSSDLQGDLEWLAFESGQLNSSAELGEINQLAEDLKEKERRITNCKLWGLG